MLRKEGKNLPIVDILIGIVIVLAVSYLAYNLFIKDDRPSTEIPRDAFYDPLQDEEAIRQDQQMEEEPDDSISWDWMGGGGGSGEIIIINSGAGGGGGGGGTGTTTNETSTEPETEPEPEETPTATLILNDFEYELISYDTAKVTSLSYTIQNDYEDSLTLNLLVYIYDEHDDISKKGLVRDQISLGSIGYKETITSTEAVSAYYVGNLAAQKTLKLTLIGYVSGESYNLASVTETVRFS